MRKHALLLVSGPVFLLANAAMALNHSPAITRLDQDHYCCMSYGDDKEPLQGIGKKCGNLGLHAENANVSLQLVDSNFRVNILIEQPNISAGPQLITKITKANFPDHNRLGISVQTIPTIVPEGHMYYFNKIYFDEPFTVNELEVNNIAVTCQFR